MSDEEVEVPAAAEPPPIAEQPAPAAQAQAAVPLQGIQPPTGLNLSSTNKAEVWKLYKQQWKNYEIVAQLNRQTEEYRIALFLYSIGPQAVKTYNGFDLSQEDRRNLDAIIAAFDRYAIGETNETFERYLFNKREQQEGESIDQYVAELRILAQSCNFCNCLHDSLIRDRIVLGIKDSGARKRLLQQQQLTLQRCIDICKASEASNTQIKSLGQSVKEDVRKVKEKNKKSKRETDAGAKESKQKDRKLPDKKPPARRTCKFCGGNHRFGRQHCPAWGAKCSSCGKENQFAKCCQSTKRNRTHAVREEHDENSSAEDDMSESDYIDCVTLTSDAINTVEHRENAREIYAEMILKGKAIHFHVDCGATVNVLPAKYVGHEEIKPTKKVLQMWNKSELKPEGVTRVTIRNPRNGKKYSIEFVVVKEELTPLLGAKASQHMGLLEIHPENFVQVTGVKQSNWRAGKPKTAEVLIEEYQDVFEGDLGTLPGVQRLEVDPRISPNISPSRRVPLALKPGLKQELEKLTKLGVIAPMDAPTDWVSNVVIATKPSGDLRICIDPKELNKALKRERYPIPVIEDVLPELTKARVFTKVDARNGYWHVVLDEESAKLTTFDTPFGRYYWKRLPLVSVSPLRFSRSESIKLWMDCLVCLMYMMTWLYMEWVTLTNRQMRITTET